MNNKQLLFYPLDFDMTFNKSAYLKLILLFIFVFNLLPTSNAKENISKNLSFSEQLDQQWLEGKTNLNCLLTTSIFTISGSTLSISISQYLSKDTEIKPILMLINTLTILTAFNYSFFINENCYYHPSTAINELIIKFRETCLKTNDPEYLYHCLNQWLKHSITREYTPVLWDQLEPLIYEHIQSSSNIYHFTPLDFGILLQNQEIIDLGIQYDIKTSYSVTDFLNSLPDPE